jgi:predicted metal-dependent HD superfamily phosphohydrolase
MVLGVPTGVIEAVRELVLASDHRDRSEPPGGDTSAFLDADLAVLGASEERYARYAKDIRKEYDWVPDETYRAGRIRVLQRFLDRPRIFNSVPAFESREAAARRNIAAEIARLSQGP